MRAAQSAVVWAASIMHRQIELNGNIAVSLTTVTLYRLTGDLLGIVIGHVIRGYSARVYTAAQGRKAHLLWEQALPKVMPGLPSGPAHCSMCLAMTNTPALHQLLISCSPSDVDRILPV